MSGGNDRGGGGECPRGDSLDHKYNNIHDSVRLYVCRFKRKRLTCIDRGLCKYAVCRSINNIFFPFR